MSAERTNEMIAVVVVRDGELPVGAVETTLEANGEVLLIGTGVEHAAQKLMARRAAHTIWTCTIDTHDFGDMADAVADHLCEWHRVLCPGSPDGRDLAPRLSHLLGFPLFSGAIRIRPDRITVTRAAGQVGEEHVPPPRFVATLIPGTRGVEEPYDQGEIRHLAPAATMVRSGRTVTTIAVDPPDPSTMDLVEAERIVGGGQGLRSAGQFSELQRFASAIGASLGGTRVASDAGWIPFERQIGTTGVIVNPLLYLAFGISGATQHTTGLGDPEHVISVNLDPSCPMMAMADLAIVADANAVIDALNRRLDGSGGSDPVPPLQR